MPFTHQNCTISNRKTKENLCVVLLSRFRQVMSILYKIHTISVVDIPHCWQLCLRLSESHLKWGNKKIYLNRVMHLLGLKSLKCHQLVRPLAHDHHSGILLWFVTLLKRFGFSLKSFSWLGSNTYSKLHELLGMYTLRLCVYIYTCSL